MELAAEAEPAGGAAEPPGAIAAVRPGCCPAPPAEELAPLAQAVASRPAAAHASTRPVAAAAGLGPVPRIPVTPRLMLSNVTSSTQAAACRFPPLKGELGLAAALVSRVQQAFRALRRGHDAPRRAARGDGRRTGRSQIDLSLA